MTKLPKRLVQLLAAAAVGYTGVSDAYDAFTHEAINVRGALESTLRTQLRDDLGFREGIEETVGSKRVVDWIREGGVLEDAGFRFRNHFHHPLRSPWRAAGLNDVFVGTSSIIWGQTASQGFSWINARQSYRTALTDSNREKLEKGFTDTFRALGQIMHLVADASVPAHVRNDSHALGDPYEQLVELRAGPQPGEKPEDARNRFLSAFVPSPPTRPDDSFVLKLPILGQNGEDAPVPVARLWDTDQYDGTNPPITLSPRIGITEYANANFFSRSTMFTDTLNVFDKHFSPVPSSADVELFTDPSNNRKYWRKIGATQEEPQHLAVVSKRLFWQQSAGVDLQKRGWLDDKVHEDYARLLLPRAVGYSAALLDYFFRGKLDVDLVQPDSDNASLLQLIGANGSDDPLVDGTLTLYSDDPSGVRTAVSAVTSIPVNGVQKGQELFSTPVTFQAPENTERFVAVYQGTLGLEKKDGTFPGGVIGKVLGGVRVEEVFSDGVRWKLRTPKGIFLLPLMVDDFEDIRWGDGDNTLVARAVFTPEQPIRVVAYEVQRLPDSIELKTVDTPDGPEIQLTKITEAGFPFNMPAVTTAQFSQTVQYRQQLVRYDRTFVSRWNALRREYEPLPTEYGPYQVETVHQQTVPFTESFPVVLDIAHNSSFGTERAPYVWSLQEAAADASGRLLGVVVVFLTSPTIPKVKLPSFNVDPGGGLTVAEQVSIFPAFPPGVGPLWVLVDLRAGRLVASTADPTVTITSQTRAEGPPWGSVPFVSTAGIAFHDLVRLEGGGPFDCLCDFGWVATSPPFRQRPANGPPAQVMQFQSEEGFFGISVGGLPGGELRDELARLGLGGFQLSTGTGDPIEVNVNCSGATLDTCRTLWFVPSVGAVVRSPARLQDARRSRPVPAPGTERLVLTTEDGRILVWNPGTSAQVVLDQPGFRFAGPVTRSTVMVFDFSGATFEPSTILVPLEGTRPPIVFPGQFLFGFTLLDPSYLYSVQELKFFRSKPPLQRTALPAKLADLPDGSNPVADYHAIRLR